MGFVTAPAGLQDGGNRMKGFQWLALAGAGDWVELGLRGPTIC